jgi:hypothetical protein
MFVLVGAVGFEPTNPSLVRRRIGTAFGLITLYDVLVSLAAGDRGYPLDAAANGTAMAR